MTSWQIVRIMAGAIILLGLALGAPASPLFVSEYWLWLSAFAGANLLQSGFTRWCLAEKLLRRFGVRGED